MLLGIETIKTPGSLDDRRVWLVQNQNAKHLGHLIFGRIALVQGNIDNSILQLSEMKRTFFQQNVSCPLPELDLAKDLSKIDQGVDAAAAYINWARGLVNKSIALVDAAQQNDFETDDAHLAWVMTNRGKPQVNRLRNKLESMLSALD
jgi:hypothetical protein